MGVMCIYMIYIYICFCISEMHTSWHIMNSRTSKNYIKTYLNYLRGVQIRKISSQMHYNNIWSVLENFSFNVEVSNLLWIKIDLHTLLECRNVNLKTMWCNLLKLNINIPLDLEITYIHFPLRDSYICAPRNMFVAALFVE